MKDTTAKLLAKAKQARGAAELLLKAGEYDAAANRAYYCMFHVAQALLNEDGLEFKKHSAVHGAFGVHYAKAGRLDPQYHRWLIEAFNKRLLGDYGVQDGVALEDADEMVSRAADFIAAARSFLQPGQ